MKKILLFLLTLLVLAPDISAKQEEEVFLAFYIPNTTNNTASVLISEAGVYSKKQSEDAFSRTNYNAQVWWALSQTYAKPYNDPSAYPTTSTTYGIVSKFEVKSQDEQRGFTVEFDPILRTVPSGGKADASKGYPLSFQGKNVSSSNYGANNGLYLTATDYPYTPTIKITSQDPLVPIKKVRLGKTNASNPPLSSFTQDFDINELFSNIDSEGSWSFDTSDNCWVYTLNSPAQSISLKVNTGASNAIRLNKLGVVWDAAINAPSVKTPLEGDMEYDKATDRYTYTEIPAVIKFDMPEGGTKMKYVSAANTTIDVSNWNDYDPATGITLPEDAVFGQTTTIQILAFDENDEAGIVRTVVCERIAPKAPNKPAIIQYSKSFDYSLENSAGVQAKVNPGSWVALSDGGVLYADKNALVIDLMEPYDFRYQTQNNHDFTEKPVGTLEYALTSYSTPDAGTTFYEATTFKGSSAQTDQNTWGNQNTWFVTGFPDEYKVNGNIRDDRYGINNQAGNLLQNTGRDYYLHLRAYKQTSTGEKIYGDILTVKVEYTPLDAPVLSKPSNEKYSWTGGAISRMNFAGSAIVNVELPDNAPEGTYIEYTFEGGTSHNVYPATISRTKVDGSNRIIVNSVLMENQRQGRIFLHAKNDAQGIESEWVMFDVEQLQTQNFYTDNYAAPTGGFNQNELVLVNGSGANPINPKLRVVDVFATDAGLENGKTTFYVYLEDYFHNGLRLIVNSRTEPAVFSTYKKGDDGKDRIIDSGEILGRISFQNQTVDDYGNVVKTMPEILITPSATESYIDYLPDAEPGDFEAVNNASNNMVFCPDMLSVGATEFSRKVRVRGLESLVGYDDRVRDTEGNEYLLYPRVQIDGKDFRDQISSMEDGNRYAVTGYVGQTGGMITIIPTEDIIECPDSPELFAPNPVTDGELNAISPELSIQIKNIRMPLAYFWSVGKVDPVTEFEKLNKVPTSNIIVLEKTAYENAYPKNVCDLYVYSKSLDTEKNADELWCLEPTNITVTWHDVDHVVNSIAEFKDIYIGHEAELPEAISQRVAFRPTAYCQFDRDSRAVVIEATPEWLYVRDLQKPESGFSSNNYILIHNENQWVNPPVPVGTDGTETRMLSKGDIITNFALIPARSHRGNLISESTGFARTFWFQDSIENFDPETRVINVGYVDPDADQYYSNVLATKDECERFRMRLLEIKNVKVTKGGDADNPDYYLTIGNEDEMPIALSFDIFEECRNGWDNAYDPEDPDAVYDIKGVLIRNENVKDSESYAFAMIDFNTNKGQVADPKVYATGVSNKDAELQNFVLKLEINIDHEEGTSVFYSTNGKDPRVNTDAETRQVYDGPFEYTLPAGQDRMTLKAFAYKPGMKPSATVSRIFVKNSTDIQYIINFLNIARKDRFYRFTDNMKVISVGGKYAFLAGSMGGFLPIYKEDGWDNTEVAPGRYITNFTVGYTEDDHGNRMAVATGLGDSFNSISSPRGGEGGDFPHLEKTPQEIEFHAEPDTITSISELNARRLVTVMSVTLHKAASADLAQEEQWIIEDQQSGENHPFMVGRLGNVYVSSKGENGADVVEELRDGATYNITGFVMLGERNRAGSVEFWPVQANRVNRTAKPTARITNYTNRQILENGDIIAQFHGTATVELRHNEPTASIYYKFDSESPEGNLSEGRWYLYQHPIVMTKSDVIRIKAQDLNYAESNLSVITLTSVDESQDVQFDVKAEYGKTTVTITAEEGATIWYGINDPNCPNRLRGALPPFTEKAILYACAQAPGKLRGKVSQFHVVVLGGETSTVSGNVKFEIDEAEDGGRLVKISPVDNLTPGSYAIYYTLQSGVPFAKDKWTKYTTPFEMNESGIVMAVLEENNKPVGKVAETYVWVNKVSGIDGVDSDNREENSVRVEGNTIIAPEGSVVFDISGRRVNPEGLRRGIYIVQIPGAKAVKIMVK